jgi:hypothetical protein
MSEEFLGRGGGGRKSVICYELILICYNENQICYNENQLCYKLK